MMFRMQSSSTPFRSCVVQLSATSTPTTIVFRIVAVNATYARRRWNVPADLRHHGPSPMTWTSNRLVVIGLLIVSLALLVPGLFAPVLTIRGVLTREGIGHVAPMMLERGLSDETVAAL